MRLFVRIGNRGRRKGIVDNVPRIREASQERFDRAEQRRAVNRARQQPNRATIGGQALQRSADLTIELAPRRLLPSLDRMLKPSTVVESKDRRLTHRTELALRDRMFVQTFQFDRAAVAILHEQSATCGARSARRRVVIRSARRDFFGLNEIGNRLLDRSTPATNRDGPTKREARGP